MGNLYAATPGQSPGVARIYIYINYVIGISRQIIRSMKSYAIHPWIPPDGRLRVLMLANNRPLGCDSKPWYKLTGTDTFCILVLGCFCPRDLSTPQIGVLIIFTDTIPTWFVVIGLYCEVFYKPPKSSGSDFPIARYVCWCVRLALWWMREGFDPIQMV